MNIRIKKEMRHVYFVKDAIFQKLVIGRFDRRERDGHRD